MEQLWLWIGFNAFVLAMLAVDLLVFHKEAHEVRAREAAAWSLVWIVLALVFGGGVYRFMGRDAGLEYFTGYLIEKALSVENIRRQRRCCTTWQSSTCCKSDTAMQSPCC